MKFTDYIKDKILEGIILIISLAVMLIFMSAFHVSGQLTAVILSIYIIASLSFFLLDFFRKRKFYNNLQKNIKNLDKKYLICETIEYPDFYEGDLLCEILDEANKSMCDNIAEYRRRISDFREFIEMWVHEIKLPVASLLLMLHNHKSELSPKFAEQLRKIDGFTDTVLYYARIDNAEKDYIIKEYSLKKVVSNTIKKYREELLLHNVELQSDIPDIAVMTDGKWLEFILGQFMANSLKYFDSSREPEIFLSAKENSESVSLSFRDNGIGIPDNDIPYIFEKSFTGQNGRTHARSTGMGLFICRRLCEKLGHAISVKSVQGEYTELIISFAKNDFYKFS